MSSLPLIVAECALTDEFQRQQWTLFPLRRDWQ